MNPPSKNPELDLLKGSIGFPDEFFRELFAAAALSGLIARDRGPQQPEDLARLTYQYADAMLASAARPTTPQ